MSDQVHVNRLTPAEAERLALLLEECGEVVHVVGKILRHGYDSRGSSGLTNRSMLESEIGDLRVAVEMLFQARDVSRLLVDKHAVNKIARLSEYLHYAKAPRELGTTNHG